MQPRLAPTSWCTALQPGGHRGLGRAGGCRPRHAHMPFPSDQACLAPLQQEECAARGEAGPPSPACPLPLTLPENRGLQARRSGPSIYPVTIWVRHWTSS